MLRAIREQKEVQPSYMTRTTIKKDEPHAYEPKLPSAPQGPFSVSLGDPSKVLVQGRVHVDSSTSWVMKAPHRRLDSS